MKITHTVFTLLILLVYSGSSKNYNDCPENCINLLSLSSVDEITSYNGKLFSGVGYELWRPNQLRAELNFKNGLLHGSFKMYHENGQLYLERTLKDGLLNGTNYEYTESGQLKYESDYKDGFLDGWDKEYWTDETNHLYEKTFYTNGVKNGLHVRYWSTGQEMIVGSFVNDKTEGLIRLFYPDGRLWSRSNYVNGELHGLFEYWKEDGVLITSNYENGKIILD